MPVLHKYKDNPGNFIKANIKGNIVTFQLTNGGFARLTEAGFSPKNKFPLQLLVDLVRSGDAYTGGSGTTKVSDPSQLEFDFTPDPRELRLFFGRYATGQFLGNRREAMEGPRDRKRTRATPL